MTTDIMAAEAANPLIPNGWEMLVTAVGFFILLFVAIKWIVPMFERTYAERSEAIEGGLAKAEQAQKHALQQRRLGAGREAPAHRNEAEEGNQAIAHEIERVRL